MSDVLIQVRVDSTLKKHAENVLMAMGLKTSEAIRIFLQQTINDQAFPFQPNAHKTPNKTTLKAFKEVKNGQSVDSTLVNFKKSLKTK
ncbi:MAG: type II toxin-antitoxin system RelB/DinJ family antitoxin [Pseudomonadota bacterium]